MAGMLNLSDSEFKKSLINMLGDLKFKIDNNKKMGNVNRVIGFSRKN